MLTNTYLFLRLLLLLLYYIIIIICHLHHRPYRLCRLLNRVLVPLTLHVRPVVPPSPVLQLPRRRPQLINGAALLYDAVSGLPSAVIVPFLSFV